MRGPYASGALSHPHVFTSSTRLLFWRPSGVSLEATGFVAPIPLAANRDGSTAYVLTRNSRTACARFSESDWLNAAPPTLSVCPTIVSLSSGCSCATRYVLVAHSPKTEV